MVVVGEGCGLSLCRQCNVVREEQIPKYTTQHAQRVALGFFYIYQLCSALEMVILSTILEFWASFVWCRYDGQLIVECGMTNQSH